MRTDLKPECEEEEVVKDDDDGYFMLAIYIFCSSMSIKVITMFVFKT